MCCGAMFRPGDPKPPKRVEISLNDNIIDILCTQFSLEMEKQLPLFIAGPFDDGLMIISTKPVVNP